ncbi:MAG: biotin-dependent carboxyltransferase family protein [Lachnospiraceae bacterium]|nr:biotin-dependent carboxyltransferase family protein [Lachnospiraceae bacterium]
MGFRVIKGGLLTTVQDLGRSGYQSQGFNVGGVMDRRSFRIANLLLDNPENEAVLECTLIGPTLEFTSDQIIAITGGDFRPELNDDPVPMYTAIYVNKGDVLKVGSARTGRTCYIAFSNYLQIPVVMGSRSTNLKCGIGGFKGRKLNDGDYISTRIKRRKYLPFFLSRTLPLHEFDGSTETIRVVMGPQDDMFSSKGIETFLGSEFTISGNFDRMGVRMDGPFVESKTGSDIISDGIALGAIQVPAHGKPIILLADHQTAGGYAKIGTVASVDLPKVVQRRIDDKIRFKSITVEEAQYLIKVEEHEYQEFRNRIHKPCKEVLEVRLTAHRLEKLFV